jgi:catalase
MTVNGNQGSAVNYEPSSFGSPVADPTKKHATFAVFGNAGRYAHDHPNTDFEQPRALFRKVMNETDRTHLIENIVGSLGGARRDIQEKMVKLFYKVDPEYGERVAKGLNIPV